MKQDEDFIVRSMQNSVLDRQAEVVHCRDLLELS